MVYFWLCLSAFTAGVMNAVAGGGTLLTFPSLLMALPGAEVAANVTSTVALLPGSVASAVGFRKELASCRRWVVVLTVPSLLGGLLGALALLQFPKDVFRFLIPWLLLLAAMLFLLQPTLVRFLRREHLLDGPKTPPKGWTLAGIVVAQLLIGIYGGYFGAGIGILMLTSLAFLDLANIHEMNALKSWLALCMNGISAALFMFSGEVVWPFALAMAAAAIAGGYLGARVALLLPPRIIRLVVIAIGFGLAAYYFVKP